MTEKRYSHDGVTIIDHLKKDLIYIEGKENLLEIAEYVDKLQDENEQLKKRNDRQAKQLDRLYSLIEEKDWIALSDIIDDFKRCEEQLQKEWGIYDESE